MELFFFSFFKLASLLFRPSVLIKQHIILNMRQLNNYTQKEQPYKIFIVFYKTFEKQKCTTLIKTFCIKITLGDTTSRLTYLFMSSLANEH